MEDKLDTLIKAVNDLKTSNNKLISSINSLSEKVVSITNKVNNHSAQLNNLSSELASLTSKVETLEAYIASSNNKSSILIDDNLISEMIDRQSRRNNVLLFNFTEVFNDSTNASSDSTFIQNILDFLNLKSKPISVTRLGKPSSSNTSKPRPVKLRFSDQKDIFELFSYQNKLKTNSTWKDLRFSSDRTK
jgi:TolA-binding protein